MNGLDLESFLWLLRADLGAWALLGVGTLLLGLLVWLSWGSRRALRKCLALSILAHAGLILYGSTVPAVFRALGAPRRDPLEGRHIRTIRVTPSPSPGSGRADALGDSVVRPLVGPTQAASSSPDLLIEPGRLADSRIELDNAIATVLPDPPRLGPTLVATSDPLPVSTIVPQAGPSQSSTPPEPRTEPRGDATGPAPPGSGPTLTSADATEFAPQVEKLQENRGGSSSIPSMNLSGLARADLRRETLRDLRQDKLAPRSGPSLSDLPVIPPLATVMPSANLRPAAPSPLADLTGPSGSRSLTEVPQIYRSRLDTNRSARAQQSGASEASEQAVERSLDWLAQHQDADGRWDGATMRYEDGAPASGDDDFTVHCPAGQTCFGESAYWEADTGLTGLALLAYLGAGYTHKDGKYQTTVNKGLEFLIAQQKPDGDLRGLSKAVGMYCHAMAALALCEAYALSLDDHLRGPAERAVSFLVRARARDGEAWRYVPGAVVGDTSILGWVVMVFKSAREVGVRISGLSDVNQGALRWLDRVATGQNRGLARYQPWEQVTPTMTAEAWVCRQFLGVGGPGASSTEAAAHLLKHDSDRGETNYYYWYYGTLAMYQHGGASWARWNDRVRDRLVQLQRKNGHPAGSWDPDESLYGARGGRIYCTAMATLTLEVYYRYLRLYDEPSLPVRSQSAKLPTLEGPERR